MKRSIALALLLALLCGCEWMDGSYVSVTPHQVGADQRSGDDVRVVSTYSELRGTLIGLIDDGSTEGLFSLADYPRENVIEDMENAVAYVTGTYPIGAYAVESIDYAIGTGLGSNAMSVDITYRHTKSEIDRIRTVRWVSGARDAIADALDGCEEALVLQITGYQTADFVQIARDYAAENPDRVMEIPQVTAAVYPDRGDTRVLELTFSYQTSREELRAMQEQVQPVFSSAALYVTGQAEERTKFTQLHTFLTERFDYTLETSITPAYSLLCQGVGDSTAFSRVYAAMCRRIGLEAMSVCGTKNGADYCWNIVRIGEQYYHADLLASPNFTPLTDDQMAGYDWDREAYPACGEAEENSGE